MIIDKSAPEGNAFAVMGFVRRLLKETDRLDEWPAAQERMQSGDYNNLCAVASEVTYGAIEFIGPDADDWGEDDV